MIKEINNFPEPSEEFKRAVIDTGSISVDCELCGRYHFGNDENTINESYGEGKFQRLIKKSKKNPDKYVYHSNEDMISWGEIDGKSAVIDCSCNKLSQYENLFWNSRNIISDYFSSRAKEELSSAQSDKNLTDKVMEAVK